jgi:hypothetical protein
MMKTIFCPKCGADSQNVESYCKRCGEWLPDIDALIHRKLFRKLTREQKIEKIRILEAVSAGLSLTSAAIIISILAGGDRQILFLAAFCCILVAVYQMINIYLGYKLQHRIVRSHTASTGEMESNDEKRAPALGASAATQVANSQSVTENTTELLEPVHTPRVTERDK